MSASFHLWSILRGNGDHTPIQDLESYESILRESLSDVARANALENRLATHAVYDDGNKRLALLRDVHKFGK